MALCMANSSSLLPEAHLSAHDRTVTMDEFFDHTDRAKSKTGVRACRIGDVSVVFGSPWLPVGEAQRFQGEGRYGFGLAHRVSP